ncbi:MAG: serine hydrolase [Chitinophagales bacterium]
MSSKTYTYINSRAGLFFLMGLVLFQPILGQSLQETKKIQEESENQLKQSNLIAIVPIARPTETPTDKLIKVQHLLRTYSNIGRFSGVAILAKHGKPIHKFTTKYSTLDFKIRCALSTQFNTCNLTQTFTATAIVQLAEQGKLDLKGKVGEYFPDIPTEVKEISIHQLLTHTSGLKDYYNLEEYRKGFYDIKNMQSLIDLTMKYPLDFVPGTKVQESTIGYLLLGGIIEKVSGMSYQAYVQNHIFEPNQMEDSGLYSWFNPAEQQAVGYVAGENDEPISAPEYWGAHAFGADAVHCSIEDLLKYSNAFHGGKLLSKEQKDLVLNPYYTSSNNPDEGIGYGWKTKEVAGQSVIYQGGALGGISVALRHYPKNAYTMLIYSNFGESTATILIEKVEEILTTDHVTVPNHSIGYILYELIDEKGIDYAKNNFDAIVEENNLVLKNIWPLYSLGQDYLKENKPEIALPLFELAIERYPNEPILYDAAGDTHHLLGNKAMAVESFEKKLRILPSDQRAKRMLKVIESTDYVVATKPQVKSKAETISEMTLADKIVSESKETLMIETSYQSNTSKKNNEPIDNSKVRTAVDVMPEFPGGQSALHQYIYQNLRYPTIAYINTIEGTIYIDFIVDSYGNIISVKANTPIEGNDGGLTNEALRIVNSMPQWKPGIHNGTEAFVKLTIPIQFNKGDFMGSSAND